MTEVLLVREFTSSSTSAEDQFELVADVGIIFVLDAGVFATCIGGPFASDLTIRRAVNLQSLSLEDTSADWGEDLNYHVVVTRQLIPVKSIP